MTLRRAAALLAMVAFLGAAVLVATRASDVPVHPGQPQTRGFEFSEFYDVVYYPGVALLQGISPYDADTYSQTFPAKQLPLSPVSILLHAPLSAMDPADATRLYMALMLVLVLFIARGVGGIHRFRDIALWTFGFAAFVVLSWPGQTNLLSGQVTLQVLAGCLLALHYGKSAPGIAGFGLLLASIKPTFAVPLLLVVLARRQYRAFAVGCVLIALAAAVPMLYLVQSGHDPAAVWNGALAHLSVDAAPLTGDAYRIDAVYLLSQVAPWQLSTNQQLLAAFVLLLPGLAALTKLAMRDDEKDAAGLAAALGCLMIASFYYHPSYDALLLILPLTSAVASITGVWTTIATPVRFTLLLVFTAVLMNYLATANGARLFGNEGWEWQAITLFNAAAIIGGYGLLTAIALFARRPT